MRHQNLDPFPHTIFDGMWDPNLLVWVLGETMIALRAGVHWKQWDNDHEVKLESLDDSWGPATQALAGAIKGEKFTAAMRELSGVDDLEMDFLGGGWHVIPEATGHLDMHVDYNRHTDGRFRRLNCLIYLNPHWTETPGGCLFLGKNRSVEVAPEFNRTVIFNTGEDTWHGHPDPASRMRFSFAAYGFSSEPSPDYTGTDHSTIY